MFLFRGMFSMPGCSQFQTCMLTPGKTLVNLETVMVQPDAQRCHVHWVRDEVALRLLPFKCMLAGMLKVSDLPFFIGKALVDFVTVLIGSAMMRRLSPLRQCACWHGCDREN